MAIKKQEKMRKSGKLLFGYTSNRSFLIDDGIQCGFIMGPVKFNLCFLSNVKAMSDSPLCFENSLSSFFGVLTCY